MGKEKEQPVEKYVEKLDIPRATLSEAADQLRMSIKYRQRRGALLLVGEAGLGKTQLVRQVAEDLGYKLQPIHTAHWGLMGSGIPQRAEGDFFKVAVPDIFPKQGEKTIMFFDELNRGLSHAIQQFFTLMEDGSMLNYKLPDDCIVVGAMNPATAAYMVTAIENEPAIRRRVKFLYVIPDFKGWAAHAASDRFHADTKRPCHPEVLAYFKAHPSSIYDHRARDAGRQYTCPATIETISEDAWNISSEGVHLLHGSFAQTRYAGSIGSAMATQLCAYIQDRSVTIGADDVLYRYEKVAGKIKKAVKKEQHEHMAELCSNVLQLLFSDQPEPSTVVDDLLQFHLDIPYEMAGNIIYSMRGAADQSNSVPYLRRLMNALQDKPAWIEIQKRIDSAHRETDKQLKK